MNLLMNIRALHRDERMPYGNQTASSLMLDRRIARGHVWGVTTGRILVTDEIAEPDCGRVRPLFPMRRLITGHWPAVSLFDVERCVSYYTCNASHRLCNRRAIRISEHLNRRMIGVGMDRAHKRNCAVAHKWPH